MVRPFPGEGVRVTVGETEANDIFLQTAAAFRKERVLTPAAALGPRVRLTAGPRHGAAGGPYARRGDPRRNVRNGRSYHCL